MRVLGVEGTAWCASAALFEGDADGDADIEIFSEAYQPDSGGINPREAAEHMREAVPEVIQEALDYCEGPIDAEELRSSGRQAAPIDAVAFSRGPGLGPCLRVAGTAARALAGTLDVPLVGANHMVAHLEIGRRRSGFEAPVCLNASGANAHALAYRNGRYRVLGETMDTGAGNAIDKFTRHLGWSHPGGPKVEKRARDGEYHELPYVVKGMDFSFSGIMSAAKQAVDDGVPVEDVCCGLEETIFAMLTEVAERALSLTGRDELVLGGGVGQNDRLREMLAGMCAERGAEFFAPEPRFLRDNAGMIAALGAQMYAAGDTLEIAESNVLPSFRPDEVDVTWRTPDPDPRADTGAVRGAEATVEMGERVTKTRPRKEYRHPELDDRLRRDRTVAEARLTSGARRAGVPTPVVFDVDTEARRLELERVGAHDLRDAITEERVRETAGHLATLHDAGVVHGDPTVRNVRVAPERTYLIDFGLGYHSEDVEDYAMDLHVFRQSLAGTAADPELVAAVTDAYPDSDVLERLAAIEGRGRYQ